MELLTQTQKMVFDSDDEEKSEILSGEELLTQTQKMVFDSDDNMEILTPTALNALLLKKANEMVKTGNSIDNKNKNNKDEIVETGNSIDNKNKKNKDETVETGNSTNKSNDIHYYLEQAPTQAKKAKFYPPEIVRNAQYNSTPWNVIYLLTSRKLWDKKSWRIFNTTFDLDTTCIVDGMEKSRFLIKVITFAKTTFEEKSSWSLLVSTIPDSQTANNGYINIDDGLQRAANNGYINTDDGLQRGANNRCIDHVEVILNIYTQYSSQVRSKTS